MMVMISVKENFWMIMPVIIIIPVIITAVSIQEKSESEIISLAIKQATLENEFKIKEVSANIESVYELIDSKIDLIGATSSADGKVSEDEFQRLLNFVREMNEIVPIGVTLASEDFEIFFSRGLNISKLGSSIEDLQYVADSDKTMRPTIGHILEKDRILAVISHPYTDSQGIKTFALVTFALEDIVEKHGNIKTEESEFLFVMDKNYDIIVDPVLEGYNWYDDFVINYVDFKGKQEEHYDFVFAEKALKTAVYTNSLGERISSGIPLKFNGEVEYFLFLVTPTASIYKTIDEITLFGQIQTAILMILVGMLVTFFSLKQRKRTKRDKLAIIGQLSSNIAHDIRNPLGAIRSSSIIIEKENNEKNEAITREVNRLKISTKRISHQVEEVLNYIRTTPLNLKRNPILRTVNDAVESIDAPENISVTISNGEGMEFAYDKEKILIVFVNIMLNAAHAIDTEKGHINISMEKTRSHAVIHFENSGPKIPENILPKIFEPLFTTQLKGTGLGLSSCKNIIEQHGGSITVSQMPVTFSVRIPVNLE